jgi:hypothetical protein
MPGSAQHQHVAVSFAAILLSNKQPQTSVDHSQEHFSLLAMLFWLCISSCGNISGTHNYFCMTGEIP